MLNNLNDLCKFFEVESALELRTLKDDNANYPIRLILSESPDLELLPDHDNAAYISHDGLVLRNHAITGWHNVSQCIGFSIAVDVSQTGEFQSGYRAFFPVKEKDLQLEYDALKTTAEISIYSQQECED